MDIDEDILSSAAAIADAYGWKYVSQDAYIVRFTSKENDLKYAIVQFDTKKNCGVVIFGESIIWDTPLIEDDLICFSKIVRLIEEYFRSRSVENGTDQEEY